MRGTLEDLFKKELEVNVPVKSVTILGQRICLVELENKEDKIRIMKNKNKLRKLTGKTIYEGESNINGNFAVDCTKHVRT